MAKRLLTAHGGFDEAVVASRGKLATRRRISRRAEEPCTTLRYLDSTSSLTSCACAASNASPWSLCRQVFGQIGLDTSNMYHTSTCLISIIAVVVKLNNTTSMQFLIYLVYLVQGVPFNEWWPLPQGETSFSVPSLRSRIHLDQFLVSADKEDSKISRIVRETPHVPPETRIDDHGHIGGDEGHLTQFYVVRIPHCRIDSWIPSRMGARRDPPSRPSSNFSSMP